MSTFLAVGDPDHSRLFEIAAPITLIVLATLVVAHVVVRVAVRRPMTERRKYRWSIPEKLIYAGFVLSVVVLGATSLVSVLAFGAMHGWWLVVHLVAAGAFVFFVAVMAWTVAFRFNFAVSQQANESTTDAPFPSISKIIFWIILLLSLIVVGVILASMFPVFATEQMLQLIEVHRLSGLALFAAVILHMLLVTGRAR